MSTLRASALLGLLLALAACGPEIREMNSALREGRPYVPTILHPVFPIDSTAADTLTLRKQALWNDLEALLTPEDLAALRAAEDSTALGLWEEAFWLPRDPVATTEANERRDDHAERLALARSLYPSPRPPYYDARGRALIRFGAPDAMLEADAAVTGTGYEPPMEVWRVRDMIIGFQSFANSGVFTPSGMLASREGMFEALAGGARDGLIMLENWERIRDSNSVLYEHQLEGRPLWLATSVDFFRSEGAAGTLMRVYFQMRGDELELDRSDPGAAPAWRFEYALALADPVTGRRRQGRGEHRAPARAGGDFTFLTGRAEEVVEPGDYELTLHLRDQVGDGEQIFRKTISVPRFPADSLALSDISLFRSEGVPSVESEILGAPHPAAVYRRGMKLAVYNEVYGLDTSTAGRHDCSIHYAIRGRGQPGVDSAFRDRASGDETLSTLVIDTEMLAPGDYTLTIEAVDERAKLFAITESGYRASRQRRFRVVE